MPLDSQDIRYILGIKVRKRRLERGSGLKDVAAATGLSVSYLSEIEKGKKYPKHDKLLQLARALDLPFDDLVSSRVDEELGPVRDLLGSPFLQEFPFELFGVEPEALLALLSAAPAKAGALLRSVLEVGRSYDVRVEHFLFAALRSYQHLHRNFFPDIEAAAESFLEEEGWAERDEPPSHAELASVLAARHGVAVDYERLGSEPSLAGLRSVYVEGPPSRVLINGRLLDSQKSFQLGRELGYLRLGLEERSTTSSPLAVESFDQVIHDFQAAYFAGAVLIPRRRLAAGLEALFTRPTFDGPGLLALLRRLRGTPETFAYRISQVGPGMFGLEELFFARFSSPVGEDRVTLTKILNMSRVPVPHGLGLAEHYCRRWPGLELLRRAPPVGSGDVELAAQRSVFLDRGADGGHEFFVVALSRPLSLAGRSRSSVSLGFLVDDAFRRQVRFWDDDAVPRVAVDLTCERCPLPLDVCTVRVAPPELYAAAEAQAARRAAVERLVASG